MLQFTKEVDYGIQLISALAKLDKGQLLSLHKFTDDANISFLFLQRIAKKLRMAGLIMSVKGAQGGYKLNKDFKKINVKEIVEALEGECAVSNCLKTGCGCGCGCNRADTCCSKKIFKAINDKLMKFMEEMKVSEVIGN